MIILFPLFGAKQRKAMLPKTTPYRVERLIPWPRVRRISGCHEDRMLHRSRRGKTKQAARRAQACSTNPQQPTHSMTHRHRGSSRDFHSRALSEKVCLSFPGGAIPVRGAGVRGSSDTYPPSASLSCRGVQTWRLAEGVAETDTKVGRKGDKKTVELDRCISTPRVIRSRGGSERGGVLIFMSPAPTPLKSGGYREVLILPRQGIESNARREMELTQRQSPPASKPR